MSTSLQNTKAAFFALLFYIVTVSSGTAQVIGWTQVSSPNPGPDRSQLRAISGTSSTDIWAVGHYQTSPVGQQYTASNLITHWNGSTWQTFPPLDLTNVNNDLFDVEAIDTNNVWAAGLAGTSARPQLLHYNGASWNQIQLSSNANTSYLNALKAINANDIWAVGGRSPVGTTLPYPVFAVHYNGSSWTEVPVTPLANGRHEFAAIDGIASNDVWGVGFWSNIVSYAGARFLAMHWNGSSWVDMSSTLPQSVASQNGYFTSIKMFASNDIWAVGAFNAGGYVMLHYNGTNWTEMPHPASSGTLTGTSSNNLYSFGVEINRWNGSSWSIEDSLQGQENPAFAGSVTLPNRDIWAAGRTIDANNVFRTLVYRSVSYPPRFINGARQQWQAQPNTVNSVDNFLATSDSDVAQILSYRVIQQPVHGSVSGFPATAITGNGTAQPYGTSYTPQPSYTGIDSFIVEVKVGSVTARSTVVVNVSGVLPVVLADFTANAIAKAVLLKWSTSTETNTSHFVAEHSTNGRDYRVIATIAAKGDSRSNNNYAFSHDAPTPGINYYRLTLIDRDNKNTVFPTRTVSFQATSLSVNIYPNPASDVIRISGVGTGMGIIMVSDFGGRVVKRFNYTGNGGVAELRVSDLAAGIYNLLVIPQNGQMLSGQVIKK